MTTAQFDRILHPFCRRRPFRAFLIEFVSGEQTPITHPETVDKQGNLYVIRRPDGGNIAFAAESVARLLDVPTAKTPALKTDCAP